MISGGSAPRPASWGARHPIQPAPRPQQPPHRHPLTPSPLTPSPACLQVFSGFLANLDTIPVFLRWIQYVSPMRYGYIAVAKNEFAGARRGGGVAGVMGGGR